MFFYTIIWFFSLLLSGKDVDSCLNPNIFSDHAIQAFHTQAGTVWFDQNKCDEVILLDRDIYKVHQFKKKGYNKIHALLVEPNWVYHFALKKFVFKNRALFSKILTYDCDLLQLDPKKFFFIHPCTTRFITQEGIFKKSKMLSMILSGKKMCEMHLFREVVAQKFERYIDLLKPGYLRVENLDDYFTDVRYSIQIENCIQENYFTEKLLDCFKTGTVPIYRGCSNLEDFFNMEGVIPFQTIEDLEKILPNLSKADYEKRLCAIHDNFNRAKNYPVTYMEQGKYQTDYYKKVLDILNEP